MVKELDRLPDTPKAIDVGNKVFARLRYGLKRVSPTAMSRPFPQQLVELNEGHRITQDFRFLLVRALDLANSRRPDLRDLAFAQVNTRFAICAKYRK
jgi:hypothetical protein